MGWRAAVEWLGERTALECCKALLAALVLWQCVSIVVWLLLKRRAIKRAE